MASLARDYDGDVAKSAAHLELPATQVAAALRYAARYSEEVDAAIADNAWAATRLESLIPGLDIFAVDASPA